MKQEPAFPAGIAEPDEVLIFDAPLAGDLDPGSAPLSDSEKTWVTRLREERDKINLILENITDGVLVLDEHFRILHLNSSAEIILGVERTDILYSFLGDPCPEIISASLIKNAEYYRSAELPFTNKKTGEKKVLSVYLAPLIINNASQLNFALTIRDITQEKQIEEMKSQFVSNVSHELRTPLSCIKGFASTLLNRKGLSEEQRLQFAGIIDKESDRLIRLIENLLSLSRMKPGSASLQLSLFSIPVLVEEVRNELQESFATSKTTLAVEVCGPLPEINADRDMIHQLLMNLLSNACKFSPPETAIKLTVSFDSRVNCFRITVKDHGFGISPENMKRLFTKFFRAEDKVHTVPGTGLGLSIVKTIAEKHGGSVIVESTLNKGSAFIVILSQTACQPVS